MSSEIYDHARKTEQDFPVISKRRLYAIWISLLVVFFLGILDLSGRLTGSFWINNFGLYWVNMKGISSLCFVLTSIALTFIFIKRLVGFRISFPIAIAIILILAGLLSIICWLNIKITGNESFLTRMPVFNRFLSAQSRMAISTAVNFIFIGLSIILLSLNKPRASNISHVLSLPVIFSAYLVPVSYLLNTYSYLRNFYTPMSLNSGIASIGVCAVIYLLRPETRIMNVFTNHNIGGIMARRLLPWFALMPIVFAWLQIHGIKTGLFTPDIGVLIITVICSFGFVVLIWVNSRSINFIDAKRERADEALKISLEEMENKVRERTAELLSLNKMLDTEIQERIRAEDLLKAERTRINGLLELMPAYLILLDPDYQAVYSNRFFRERFGEPGGRPCYEFLFNRSEPCEKCETYKVLEDNSPHTWEWEGPDGRIYSIYDYPYTDPDGSRLIMEMGIDISSLKKAEAKLVELNSELENRVAERISELLLLNERLDILSQTSSDLHASEYPQEIIKPLCTRVMNFLDCQVFFNYLIDEDKGRLNLHSYSGITEKTTLKMNWLNLGEAVCGCVARDGVRIVAENIPETPDPRTELVKSLGIKAYACHPLLVHDRVIGTLSFGTSTRKQFTDDDLSMMKTVTDQVSTAFTRLKDKEVLLKSEERYRSFMELSPGASFVVRDKKIVLLNSTARKLLGVHSVKELQGSSILGIFHPQSRTRIKAYLDKILKGGSMPTSDEKIIRADGTVRDVEVVMTCIADSEGPAIQIITSDVTERILAEKELFDAKSYLENLIDYANAPIIVWDKENKIKLFNHAFEHLTGYSSAEVTGKNLGLLFPKDSLKDSMRKIKHALTENWVTIEIPILTKTKDIRTVLWNSAKIYDENKKTFSTIAQGHDITERIEAERAFKESKEKLDLALENGNIGIWEWMVGTDVFLPDERMEKMLGKTPGTFEKTYDAFEKSIHEEDLPHLRNAIRQAIEKDSRLDTIFRIKRNNEVNYISTKALVEKDGQKRPVKMSGVCFDITEMKMGAEKALFTLNEELLRSNKELEQFAYVASHDLQEPLRTISSFTQLLAQRYKDKLDQDANEFIQFAVDGAVRMQLLINGLLDYSRIGTRGKKFSPVKMNDVVRHVLNNLNIIIREKMALVQSDDLPVVVADGGQMVQLLQNLISNALKFCKSKPRINISAKEESTQYVFSVSDNGIGIDRQYFAKLFQIFQRLHPRDEYGGTGIGLALCKRIVERHGGKIWVESKPGKGSVFRFTIIKR